MPDMLAFASQQGYEHACTYRAKGKSAFKGEHLQTWESAIEDMERGLFSVIVVWKLDRASRQGLA